MLAKGTSYYQRRRAAMKRSVQIIDLIRRNDSDIALFRGHIDKLAGKSGTGEYIIRGFR
jgi:hypothetical protein